MISITRFPPAIFSAMAEKSATSPTSAARIELLKARLWMGGGVGWKQSQRSHVMMGSPRPFKVISWMGKTTSAPEGHSCANGPVSVRKIKRCLGKKSFRLHWLRMFSFRKSTKWNRFDPQPKPNWGCPIFICHSFWKRRENRWKWGASQALYILCHMQSCAHNISLLNLPWPSWYSQGPTKGKQGVSRRIPSPILWEAAIWWGGGGPDLHACHD